MTRSRMIGLEYPPISKLTRARLYLFAAVIAVALVDAWPDRSVERTAIDVGRSLCEASASGTAETLAMSRDFPNVVVIGSYLAGQLEVDRPFFEQDCKVVLRVGDVPPPPGSWGDGRAHYFLVLRSRGEGRMAIRLRWEFDWTIRLPTCCGYDPGKFHIKIAPAPDL